VTRGGEDVGDALSDCLGVVGGEDEERTGWQSPAWGAELVRGGVGEVGGSNETVALDTCLNGAAETAGALEDFESGGLAPQCRRDERRPGNRAAFFVEVALDGAGDDGD